MKQLLLRAYRLRRFQLAGPDRLDSERYDIVANVPAGATTDQLPLMLQGLLEERFNLKFHLETKNFLTYDLVVENNGFKLKESVQDRETALKAGMPPPGLLILYPQSGGIVLTATAVPISKLAYALESQLGGVSVTDKTGLTGKYDLSLEFTTSTVGVQDDFAFPALSTVLKQDLGLQLVKKTAPFDVLIVDHLDRIPTEN